MTQGDCLDAPDWLPDVHWGYVGAVPTGLPYDDDKDPDDELLDMTPPEVTILLGFDPLELEA